MKAEEKRRAQVSVRKAESQRLDAWDDIVNNHTEGSLITGKITQRVKGGLIMDVKA